MKTFKLLFIIAATALAGCEKTLDLEVKDRITLDNFFQTGDDALTSVNAVYDALGDVNLYRSSLWLVQDIASDDCDALTTWNDPNAHQFDQYTLQTNNNFLAGIWQSSYTGISRANLAIERIPEIKMDKSVKNRLIAEARFLRGLYYFNLVRLFGDVPLILSYSPSIDDYLVPRTAARTVYDTIVQDFQRASTVLPLAYSGDKGRATRGAALGLLAKVHLTLGEWDQAAKKSKAVMDLNVYSLWADFAGNFKEANKNGKESVFEVQFFTGIQAENTRIVISGLPAIYAFPAGVGIMIPTTDLLSSFEPGDHRYEVTFFDEFNYFGHYTFEPHIWKHWDQTAYTPQETGKSGANFPVMRYSEIKLIYAEALNELNNGPTQEAYDAVNEVRARARNGNDTVLLDLGGLSQQEFRDAVLKEKRCETVNEGQRWFDLVRTGKLVEYVKRAKGDKANPQPFNNHFPIPQRERDINTNLSQNEGYY
jgi:hypothetical protein